MTRCGRTIACLAAGAALSVLTACYERTPLNVTVLDAETREPVAGARLYASQSGMEPFGPAPAEGTTGADGRAVLSIVSWRLIHLSAKAEGYRSTSSSRGPDGTVWIPNGAVWGEGEVTLHALRNPPPTVECALPQGFRGPFAILVDEQEGEDPVRDQHGAMRLTHFRDGAFRLHLRHAGLVLVPVAASWPDGSKFVSSSDPSAWTSGAEREFVWGVPASRAAGFRGSPAPLIPMPMFVIATRADAGAAGVPVLTPQR